MVAPGESLWSIAQEKLGPTASRAQVARLVNRLWGLNADRIRTGRPDLILPGQELIVPLHPLILSPTSDRAAAGAMPVAWEQDEKQPYVEAPETDIQRGRWTVGRDRSPGGVERTSR